jgi:phosphoglycerate dehydrogenase-like enzyme
MRVVLWTRLVGRTFRTRLETHPGIELVIPSDVAHMLAAVREAELLITDGGACDAVLAAALRLDRGRLRWIQLVTTGYESLAEHGVPSALIVTNVGDFYSATVAEHAVTLALALVRRLPGMTEDATLAAADPKGRSRPGSLQGATVALVGFGGIGREVARRLRPFGPRVVGLVRSLRPEPLADELYPMSQLEAVLARADVAVLAVPLTPATRHLISTTALAACKPGLILVNVSRGEVVDSEALAEALRAGHLGGAGLDVTDPEPLPPDHPLRASPHVILTPHIAGIGQPHAAERLADLVLSNIELVRADKPPLHIVKLSV